MSDLSAEEPQISSTTGSSAYPMTNWSMLISGLNGEASEPWIQFMEIYRTPVQNSLVRILNRWNQNGYSPAQLADDFFGWFLEKGYHQKLKRTDAAGKKHRFRGYLKYVLMHYLKDAVLPKKQLIHLEPEEIEYIQESSDWLREMELTIDQEICRDLVSNTLEVMKRDDYSSWRAFIFDFSGLTLNEVSEKLKHESQNTSSSVSKAFRHRAKARRQFLNWLVRYRLESCCLSREEALHELVQLRTPLAEAIADYRDQSLKEMA